MKAFHKIKVLLMSLVMIMTVSLSSLPLTALAAPADPGITVKTDKTAYVPGDAVVLTVSSTGAASAMAIQVDVQVDAAFTYEKVSAANSALTGVRAGLKDGKLSVNWINRMDGDIQIPAGDLFTVNLRVTEDAAVGTKTFTPGKIEITGADGAPTTGASPAAFNVTVGTPVKSENVLAAEAAIDRIDLDALDTSQASLDLITDAQLAFSQCSSAEKKLVENADKLTQAVEKYRKLKEQEAADAAAAALQQEIDAWLEDYYAPVADKTPETVAVVDKVAVNTAMEEYTKKSAYIRSQLLEEYEHLQELEDAIAVLEAQMAEETYADTFVPVFLDTYAGILNTPLDSVVYEDEESFEQIGSTIQEAMDFYNEILNEVGQARVAEEYSHLEALLERWNEVALENTPDTPGTLKAYNDFRNKYMDLLMKNPDDVTMEDLPMIQQAISEIKSMKPAVSGKLINEYEYLMELLNTLNGGGSGAIGDIVIPDFNVPDLNVPDLPETGLPGSDVSTTPNGNGSGTTGGGVQNMDTQTAGESEGGIFTKLTVSVGDAFAVIVLILLLTAVVLYLMPRCVNLIVRKKMERRQ